MGRWPTLAFALDKVYGACQLHALILALAHDAAHTVDKSYTMTFNQIKDLAQSPVK